MKKSNSFISWETESSYVELLDEYKLLKIGDTTSHNTVLTQRLIDIVQRRWDALKKRLKPKKRSKYEKE
jgi:hypothetical protein